MPNTLIIPNSGTIFFSNDTAGASTTPSLTGQAVSLAHDGQAGLVVSSLNPATSATNRFRVNGANGALLAVTDEITGTVFSVNDPAGLPIISADTGLNDVITIGTFGSNALVVRNDRVGVGTSNPNTSSALEINSTTRGVLPPRMTISQRNAIASPAEGLVVYVNDAGGKGISLHNGTAWGNVLTTHAASFTSDTLAAALTDENGTGGGFVRAEGATLTSPSLVGPVNLTSQDLNSVNRIMNRELVELRHSTRNRRITDDVTFTQNIWEQFVDFDDQYNADLVVADAFGSGSFSISPAVFGDGWNAANAGVAAFQGNDLFTHRGILLIRGSSVSNRAFYVGINRPTNPYSNSLSQIVTEFTCRVFFNPTDFTTQGYFKIGPIPKGGTGGGDASLFGGLMFNPYLHPTNLVLGTTKNGVVSPHTFTTNPANVDFLDTGFNIVNYLGCWINITYTVSMTAANQTVVDVSVTRENTVLFSASYNLTTHPIVSTWFRSFSLIGTGASREIGFQYGKFTYTARSEVFFDYLYYKITGISAAPANWNSLRF